MREQLVIRLCDSSIKLSIFPPSVLGVELGVGGGIRGKHSLLHFDSQETI